MFAGMLFAVALLAIAALALAWLQVRTQQNMRWIVLLLPLHLALFAALAKMDRPRRA
jgi:drug/metabolite transporter superfamily protein YnfA